MCSYCHRVSREQTRYWRSLETRPNSSSVIVVAGQVEKQQLFDAVQPLEEEEEQKKREDFDKPFGEPCSPLENTEEEQLEYPDGK